MYHSHVYSRRRRCHQSVSGRATYHVLLVPAYESIHRSANVAFSLSCGSVTLARADDYEPRGLLGRGTFGAVHVCYRREMRGPANSLMAVKIIRRNRFSDEPNPAASYHISVQRESAILQRLNPHVSLHLTTRTSALMSVVFASAKYTSNLRHIHGPSILP